MVDKRNVIQRLVVKLVSTEFKTICHGRIDHPGHHGLLQKPGLTGQPTGWTGQHAHDLLGQGLCGLARGLDTRLAGGLPLHEPG